MIVKSTTIRRITCTKPPKTQSAALRQIHNFLWSRGSSWRWIGMILNEKPAPISAISGITDALVGLPGTVVSAKNAPIPFYSEKIIWVHARCYCSPPAPMSTKLLCTHSHKGNLPPPGKSDLPPPGKSADFICFHRADHRALIRHHQAGPITEPQFTTTGQIWSATTELIKDLNSPPPGRSDLLPSSWSRISICHHQATPVATKVL